MSNLLEHSGIHGTDDARPGLLPGEPLEHSVMVSPWMESDRSVTDVTDVAVLDPVEHSGVERRVETRSACLPGVFSDHRGEDVSLLHVRPETERDQPEAGEAIVVGAVGSAAPWFLTGWANDMEVDFMIDTGCQVTILATTVFERMCTADLMVRSRLRPCRRRLVSADSSPLTVKGELELNVVFPGLSCDMLFVVASIGSDGLLGTEALQSCLPHQLDLRMGQLWADSRSTLQLHQQKLIPELDGFLTTSVVLPPNSEIVAPFSVSAVRELLHHHRHVFPAPGEPVTGRTTSVQHEILTSDARPVRCGPRRLAPAGLRTEQTCVTDMSLGGQIEPSDSPLASPVVLVTMKDGSTRFCVDYRRLNALTIRTHIRCHLWVIVTRVDKMVVRSGGCRCPGNHVLLQLRATIVARPSGGMWGDSQFVSGAHSERYSV